MPVFQVGENGWHQRLKDVLLTNAAQEAERDAPQILIRMLKIVSEVLADEDLQHGYVECPGHRFMILVWHNRHIV